MVYEDDTWHGLFLNLLYVCIFNNVPFYTSTFFSIFFFSHCLKINIT